jgi:hypothetical protein
MLRVVIAKARFALDRVHAVFKRCKVTVGRAAAEICAPRIALRLRADVEQVPNNENADGYCHYH